MADFSKAPPDWDRIDTVLLDMDGTLLDKHFDDHFWEEIVPRQYAKKHNLTLGSARDILLEQYRSHEKTLNWTNLDFWSEELGLDIPFLKKQVDHLINVHPHVLPFLDKVRNAGKRVHLVTNAHAKTLEMKMKKTLLAGKFHAVYTSHDLAVPKEEVLFWERLYLRLAFDPDRTFLAEDTEAVLESAAAFGIRYLVYVAKSSSTKPSAPSKRFFSIERFSEILPPSD